MKYASWSALFALLLSITLISFGANANPKPRAICSFTFEAKGTDIQVLIGYSKLRGEGKILCVNADREAEELPFKITIGTPVIFPRLSFAPSLVVRGGADSIEVPQGGAKSILDQYITMDFRAAIGTAGYANFLGLVGEKNKLEFTLALDNIEGFGIAVGGTQITIE